MFELSIIPLKLLADGNLMIRTYFFAGMNLKVFHVFDGHFDDFGFLDATAPFLHASWRQETR